MVYRNLNMALASGPLPGPWEGQTTDSASVEALVWQLRSLSDWDSLLEERRLI